MIRHILPYGFKQIQCAHCVCVEVSERNGRRKVVAGLGRRVHNGVGPNLFQEVKHSLAVANVQLVMHERLDQRLQSMLIPARITLGTEECRTLIVVDTVNLPTLCGKKKHTSDPIRPEEPVTRIFFISGFPDHSLLKTRLRYHVPSTIVYHIHSIPEGEKQVSWLAFQTGNVSRPATGG